MTGTMLRRHGAAGCMASSLPLQLARADRHTSNALHTAHLLTCAGPHGRGGQRGTEAPDAVRAGPGPQPRGGLLLMHQMAAWARPCCWCLLLVLAGPAGCAASPLRRRRAWWAPLVWHLDHAPPDVGAHQLLCAPLAVPRCASTASPSTTAPTCWSPCPALATALAA